MPKVEANGITIHYDEQGTGEPLVLIPFLAADHTCYAFQIAEYADHFTCFVPDPRGAGETDKPPGPYSTELLADDVAAFMAALGIERAHVSGLSLGAAAAIWLAAKYPENVASLSLHSAWTKTDPFLRTVIESWVVMAKALDSVTELIIRGIFPWCFTPELYASKPDLLESLAEFGRSRPGQPVEAFIRQSEAVIAHDVRSQLGKIQTPTQITFGRYDALTSTRFADELTGGIANSQLVIFEDCSHAPLYENVEEFNATTLAFLREQST